LFKHYLFHLFKNIFLKKNFFLIFKILQLPHKKIEIITKAELLNCKKNIKIKKTKFFQKHSKNYFFFEIT